MNQTSGSPGEWKITGHQHKGPWTTNGSSTTWVNAGSWTMGIDWDIGSQGWLWLYKLEELDEDDEI